MEVLGWGFVLVCAFYSTYLTIGCIILSPFDPRFLSMAAFFAGVVSLILWGLVIHFFPFSVHYVGA